MWKCRPFGWLWGLPVLALLWLPVYFEHKNIEDDLGEKVSNSFEDAGLDWAKVDFQGRDGILRGTARSTRDQDEAIALAERTYGVRIVAEDTDIVRRESPYKWSAEKEGSRLVLGGFVPDRAARKSILATAKKEYPGFEIVDDMEIASGAPDRRDFMETAEFGLKQLSGFNYGRVGLRDSKFSIDGLTKDVATFKSVNRALKDDLPLDLATNRVKAPDNVIPLASPFLWSATKKDNVVRLNGHVHSRGEKSDIVAAAKKAMPEYEIIDNMQVARGKPNKGQWKRGTSFGLSQLAKLDRGTVSLSDMKYSVKGHTENAQNYTDVNNAATKPPRGFSLARKEVTVPDIDPYIWRADYHARRVTLSGHVPDQATRKDIKAQAKRYFPKAYVLDKMEIGPGAPGDWSRATNTSLSQLSQLEDGSAMIWNREIEMRGKAKSENRRADIRGNMKSDIPSKYQFFDEIRVPEPVKPPAEIYVKPPNVTEYRDDDYEAEDRLGRDVCQSYLDSILSSQSIHFAPASAKLEDDSFSTMIRLAHTAKRCPETRIEISGHTDSDGSRKFNEFLSLRRARSVVKFLVKEGVKKDRLSAIGYGESRPILPNTNKANKARNRRIEFVVKEF